MRPIKESAQQSMRRTFTLYIGIIVGVAALLGLLHLLFADVKAGGVWWFNLDKERNIATWFSGMLLFIFACAAFAAYYWERKSNAKGEPRFHMPILWLGVWLTGLLMSLDEITILHENLFWREIRLVSEKLGDPWIYVTQWQILFAPVILFIFFYFVLFFSHRFSAIRGLQAKAFAGMGCWVGSLLLEGVRGAARFKGQWWYSVEVLIEEELEMFGIILLLVSVVFYTIEVAADYNAERPGRLKLAPRLITRKALTALIIMLLALSAGGVTIYVYAQKQAATGVPLPLLYRKARKQAIQTKALFKGSMKSGYVLPEPLQREIWFEDIKGPMSLTVSDQEALVEHIASSILRPEEKAELLPGSLREDKAPRIIFISVSDGTALSHVLIGSGKGLSSAVTEAVSQLRRIVEKGFRPRWIKVDLVQEVYPLDIINPTERQKLERSLHGLAFGRKYGIAFLPEELLASTLVDKNQRIRATNIENYLRSKYNLKIKYSLPKDLSRVTMYRFTTTPFFVDGSQVFPLYRGHRLFYTFSKEDLISSARNGGRYLVRALSPEGRFSYIYWPKTDKVSKKYNLLRHAGTVYSMLELYEVTGEEELLQAAKRAIDHLLSLAKPCGVRGSMTCIVDKGYIKLGGNGLAIIALAKYYEVTGDKQYIPIMLRLGKWIQSTQKEDGEFSVHKKLYPDGEVANFVSRYYPGEALLALTRIYALDRDESWLDAAEKGASYLIKVRDRGLSVDKLSHDHWLLYSLNELYRYRPKRLYLDHALRIAESIVLSQNRDPAYPDWLGSYYRPPRSTPTATRSEGLIAAYRMARQSGESETAEKILESIRMNIGFQLRTQFRPESVLYLKDPQRSLGGFHRSLTNFEIRIDYVQHNISSLLGLYRILEDKG